MRANVNKSKTESAKKIIAGDFSKAGFFLKVGENSKDQRKEVIRRAKQHLGIKDAPKTKSEIMRRAWEIARNAVKIFGGKVREYLSESMKLAWAEAKA